MVRTFFTVEVHTLAEQSLLCGLGFTYYYIIPLFPNTGMREAAGGRQPAAAKPFLYEINVNVKEPQKQ